MNGDDIVCGIVIGKNQFSVLTAMWIALKEYEEENE